MTQIEFNVQKINENTPFVADGQPWGIAMPDFWKYQFSSIYDIQEHIAGFILGKALGSDEPCNRDWWNLWDIEYRGKQIEIKAT